LRLFSFGGYGLALAALALVVFGAYDSYPRKTHLQTRRLRKCKIFPDDQCIEVTDFPVFAGGYRKGWGGNGKELQPDYPANLFLIVGTNPAET